MSKESTPTFKESDRDLPCTGRLKQHLEEKFGSASAGLAAMAAVVGTPLTFRSFCDALDAVGADFQSCRADLFRRLSGEDGGHCSLDIWYHCKTSSYKADHRSLF